MLIYNDSYDCCFDNKYFFIWLLGLHCKTRLANNAIRWGIGVRSICIRFNLRCSLFTLCLDCGRRARRYSSARYPSNYRLKHPKYEPLLYFVFCTLRVIWRHRFIKSLHHAHSSRGSSAQVPFSYRLRSRLTPVVNQLYLLEGWSHISSKA